MLRERLTERCATAKFVSVGVLLDHALVFGKRSDDGSGKCAFRHKPGSDVWGVLWEVADADLAELDGFEGVGRGYTRIDVDVTTSARDTVPAFSYHATELDDALRPYDWYWALVVAGARQHGLPQSHVTGLEAVARDPDPKPNRPRRLAALAVLRRAGFGGLLDG
jgi:hypothetical protein